MQLFVDCNMIQVRGNQLKSSKSDYVEKSLLYRHQWISESQYTVDQLEQDVKDPNESLFVCEDKYEVTYN